MQIFVKDAKNAIAASAYLDDEQAAERARVIAEARQLVQKAAPRGRYIEIEERGRPTFFASVPTIVLAALGCLEPERALTRDRERVDAYRYRRATA